jgi:hypothetical protein
MISDAVWMEIVRQVPVIVIGLVNLYFIYHVKHSLNSVLDKRVLDAHTIGTAEGTTAERHRASVQNRTD